MYSNKASSADDGSIADMWSQYLAYARSREEAESGLRRLSISNSPKHRTELQTRLLTLAEVLRFTEAVYTSTSYKYLWAMWRGYTATHNTYDVTGKTAGRALRDVDIRVPEVFFIKRTHNANFELWSYSIWVKYSIHNF